uniref:Nitroreductase domain-containing protein n=1 Tax=Odontella aurita TaxID=265563 RepID=A0A7S4J025_9STRA|mmetsp:Transcript_34389/g.102927  ORF Transcript_34389/g.102927 Transcript_34389/m.102927 type:complete len:279 (+) Transcript_34389:150-986(+)
MKSSTFLIIIHVAIDSTFGFAPRKWNVHRNNSPARIIFALTLTSPSDSGATASGETSSRSNDGTFRREFSSDFQLEFEELMHWRRDVRRFKKDKKVDEDILHRALSSAFHSAPSVGLSEPWRIVRIDSEGAKIAALENFQEQNTKALEGYEGDKKQKYASLKLSGMKEAPIQLAIYCDDTTTKGSGLGALSMPEMRRYSVVSAITLFWLAARCAGLGVGWVSILDPVQLTKDLGLSKNWTLVGYLCVGWPEEDNGTPELERFGWEKRTAVDDMIISSV